MLGVLGLVVTVPEFDAMSQAERQQTIQSLSESSSTDDVNNAQILMIRERELAGLNTANPTVANPVQEEQIIEAQTQNAQVYEGFVIHQEMKAAMTANQNAYAVPVEQAKTGNPVYNALHDVSGNVIVQSSESIPDVISQADVRAMPPEVGTPDYIVQNGYVQKGSTVLEVVGKNVFVRGVAGETPLQVEAGKTYVVLGPELKGIIPRGIIPDEPKAPVAEKNLLEQAQDFFGNYLSGQKDVLLNSRTSLPSAGITVGKLWSADERSAVGTVAFLTIAAVAPVLGPGVGISTVAILGSEALNVGISEGVKVVSGQGNLTINEALESAAIGGAFPIGAAGAFRALSAVPSVGGLLVTSAVGRTIVNAGLGAGVGYVLSGGNLQAAGEGALFGAAFSLLGDYVARPVANVIRSGLPDWVPGKTIKLEESTSTLGKADVTRVYESSPIEALNGKSLRVVADVTENPVGTKGVTIKTMIDEYSGQTIPTAHATLHPEKFDLSVGGKTVLTGYPELSKGFRSVNELYHFYSAPGSSEYVTVYGGYAGVGKGYSEGARIQFGGKSSALVTLDTEVTPEFLRLPGESIPDYLSRTSLLSGKTGIAQETLLGKSAERQVVTTAKYERAGVELPGSAYVSEGKVGTFQIQELPEGKLGKIPVVRTLLSKFTNIDVYKGKYEATMDLPEAKVLDVARYSSSYSRTMRVSSQSIVLPLSSFGLSEPKSILSSSVVQSKISLAPSKGLLSIPSEALGSKQSISVSKNDSYSRFANKNSVPTFSPLNSTPDYSPSKSLIDTPVYSPSKSIVDIPNYSPPSVSMPNFSDDTPFGSQRNNSNFGYSPPKITPPTNMALKNFDALPLFKTSKSTKHLWEFPVLTPEELMKGGWF